MRAIGILEDIDDQRRREEVLRERSERDTLTGLYNKGATESHIRDFLHGSPLSASALMVIDIDAFKSVNDQHGHPFGDRTLVEISRRISALFHVDDIIGRIGGDEFIVFLKNLRNHDAVEKRARDVCGAFLALISSGGITAQVTCSIGAAMVPRDGSTFEVLYQKADIALYDAKKHGKNQYRLYLPQMGSGAEWTPYSSTQIDVPEVIAAGK